MTKRLMEEFPPVSSEAWRAAVEKDLKGADFDKKLVKKSLDGLTLKPYFRAEDLPNPLPEVPRDAKEGNRWATREEIRESDLGEANAHILRSLRRGADELAVYLYPIGADVRTSGDFKRLVEEVWLDAAPIHWLCGPLSAPALALLTSEMREQGKDPAALQGSVEFDPITDACAGWVHSTHDWKVRFVDFGGVLLREYPALSVLTIRASLYEKAGASLAQEISIAAALLMEYLTAARETWGDDVLTEVVRRTEIRFGVGTNYFLEIAKVRAARWVISQVVAAFGVTDALPKFHGVTTSSNKTLYDPNNNLLRGTIEAMAAVMGGVDSLSVAAYDQGYHAPDEFSEHLARNTTTLLRDEAHLGVINDPLKGSYTVERLTHDLAHAVWELVKSYETVGGFVQAWENGTIGDEIRRVSNERAVGVSRRRRTIVGTTVYPNLQELRLPDVQARGAMFQVESPSWHEAREGVATGKELTHWLTDQRVPSTPLDSFRPSWPYEHMRLRTERFVLTGARRPLVILAELGDLTMRKARVGFVAGFLGVGGYDVQTRIVNSPEELEEVARAEKPDVIVLCSSDPEYLPFAEALPKNLCPNLIVAGQPETSEALLAAGVTDFIHIRCDLLETLGAYHDKFEIPEIPMNEPLDPRQMLAGSNA